MNVHTPPKIDSLAIPLEQIDAAIAALVALRLKPRRDGFSWYRALVTFDKIEGCDALLEAITNVEHDIGLGDADEPECLACGGSDCGCDQARDDRVSWGLTSQGNGGVWA